MKFQRIGTGQNLARIATFSLLLLASASAYAVDEDIPPPADADIPAPRTMVEHKKSATESTLGDDENIPAPSLGDESLPEPSVDRGQERAKNQVNKAPEDDEIFLPTPNVNDNVYYAPVGTPAPRVSSEDLDWRNLSSNRPVFSLFGGAGSMSFPSNLTTQSRYIGPSVGLGIRALHLGQTIFAHLYSDWTFFNLGTVGTVQQVSVRTFRIGGLLELALGRRLSGFISLFRRQGVVSSPSFDTSPPPAGQLPNTLAHPANFNPHDADNIGEPSEWLLGVAAQWDFYVVPHASAGVRLQAERDLFMLSLTISMEPTPPKKLTLNYGSMDEMDR